jgi:hypothetical protein
MIWWWSWRGENNKKHITTFLLIVLWVEINNCVMHYDYFNIGHHDVHHGLLILFFLNGLAEFIVTPFSTLLGNNYDIKFGPEPIIFDAVRIFGVVLSIIFYRLVFWSYKKWYNVERFF